MFVRTWTLVHQGIEQIEQTICFQMTRINNLDRKFGCVCNNDKHLTHMRLLNLAVTPEHMRNTNAQPKHDSDLIQIYAMLDSWLDRLLCWVLQQVTRFKLGFASANKGYPDGAGPFLSLPGFIKGPTRFEARFDWFFLWTYYLPQ